MNNSIKRTAALALALCGTAAFVPASSNVFNVQAEAAVSIKGISFFKVYEKKGTSKELQLYSDMACTTETDYKSSISKYYVKLPADQGKFNFNINTKAGYSIKMYFDESQYAIGDEMEIIQGETADVRVRVYEYNEDDDRDEAVGTITVTVMRDSGKSKTDTKSQSTSDAKSTDDKSYTTVYTSNNASSNISYKQKWVQKGLQWIYYDENGNILRNQWFKDTSNGKWYYLQANGYMTTGFRFINSEWYYFNTDGSMATGWIKDSSSGKWYYLYDSGKMARNTTIGGYRLNVNGEAIIN